MAILRRPGADINYEVADAGAGSWVVLVNGYTRPLNDFRMMSRSLQEHGFRVLMLDNRGAGATGCSAPFTITDMAQDVLHLTANFSRDPVHLLGISMGGFIVQMAALFEPDRARSLTLISTAMNRFHIREEREDWNSDEAAVMRKLSEYFTSDFALRNEGMVKSMARQIAKAVDSGDFVERANMQRTAVAGFDSSARLRNIRCPVLIVHGSEDRIVPFAAAAEMARALPAARLYPIENAGHLLLAEAPAKLYTTVAEFLKSVDSHQSVAR